MQTARLASLLPSAEGATVARSFEPIQDAAQGEL
jgi:hypothetical protein